MNGVFSRGALYGLLAGAAGTLVMTLGERLEQRFTGRPDSQVPARTLERLTGRPEPSRGTGPAMHVGQGVLLGAVRGVMSCAGLRGPWASAMFGVVRLTSDQILENATGVGAPPWTWPRRELAVDLAHKAVYAFATGLVSDLLAARHGPGPGLRHAELLPGRHEDVGPLPRPRRAPGG
ncbi:hypothetical protein SAMN02745673_04461 [Marinactinospora thermotolerans DSM 45154]|uniref:DUF1440 domain-containing protein n=1 Tax=Marinactinospora thermotolerans DSM 45154 TaxID=1122192 RepID=A0A1T4T477_9ACTN|nr:hypothetical protein [Marinactinospora thermotolerans]SKA35320.1 hypothetical protein SAMN02745673_04461 [Marinactinospora thermotolerans DSM 45154]